MRTILQLGVILLSASPLAAQSARWHLGIGLSDARFGGTSADTSTAGGGSFRPYRPTVLALSAERGGNGVRWGLGLRYASAGVALDAAEVTIVSRTGPLTLIELRPVVSVPLVRLGAGRLRADAGPVVDHWRWSAGEPRTRLGAELGASLEAALGARVYAVIRAGLTLSGSILNQADLPEAYERRMSARRSVGVGLGIQP